MTAACAHRGDSGVHRENTLPALRSAIAAGAEFVEVDVRVTADGRVVLLHDDTLQRLWGESAEVSALPWRVVAGLGAADESIPLLSEALDLFEGSASTLLIDMETAEPAAAAHRVVAAHRVGNARAPKVAWCGHLDGMRQIRVLDPQARIWMPWSLPRAPNAAELAGLAPEYVNADFTQMTRAVVDGVHALGPRVSVWTVDDEQTMRWAIDIGVDSVTTNRLGLLQRTIAHTAALAPAVDIDEALEVARGLGRWAIGFASEADPGVVSTKVEAADLVTEVDVAVERHVRAVIAERFPGHGFVGEELGGEPQAGVACWYLDPVDGTTNFANRVPWNAFSLALALDGVPLVGVVADPWRGDLFEAVSGGGARLNGEPLRVPAVRTPGDPLSGAIVSTELASHRAWPGMLQLLDELGERHCTLRIMGSGTMTVVGIAAGRGVGAVIGEFGAVDHLAATLIVTEAGGVVLDSGGAHTLFPTSGGIIAAAPAAAAQLYDIWRRSTETAGLPA
jgi:myo-inositol-1(or 4)-monophosphatase/deoxyribonuclease-2